MNTSYVDQVTSPDNSELGPPRNNFLELFRRPATLVQAARLRELGLNTDGEFERSLGRLPPNEGINHRPTLGMMMR
jgi:hypothetical protein